MPQMPMARSSILDVLKRLGISVPQPQTPQEAELARTGGVAQGIGDIGNLLKGLVTGGGAEPGMTAENLGALLSVGAPVATVAIKGAPLLGRALPDLMKPSKGALNYEFIAPVMRRIESLLELGATRPAEWADASRLAGAFNNDPTLIRRYNRGWGATSPGTDFKQSTREANRAMAMNLEGRPFTPDLLREHRFTNVPAKLPNLERAYADQPLSGDKAEAMAAFMSGEPRIPIDRHALDAVGAAMPKPDMEMQLDPLIGQLRRYIYETEGLSRGALSDTDLYKILEQAYQKGLINVAPGTDLRGTFAQLWEGTRAAKGQPYEGGVMEVLDRMGLLTPGGMTDASNLYRRSVPFGASKWAEGLK